MNAPAKHDVTVDYNGDPLDPAWSAFCDEGYWHGVWQHAVDFQAWGDAEGHDDAWQAACRAAEDSAEQDGRDHQDCHAND